MEIERKFTVKNLPENLDSYEKKKIVQAYLCREPVVRIRRSDDEYYLTYKGRGLIAREEYNLPLTKESFEHLLAKADGNIISKTRYLIPLDNPGFRKNYVPSEDVNDVMLTIELDVFDEPFSPLVIAEVEFPDIGSAEAYIPEDWFLQDVSEDRDYHNVNMAYGQIPGM